MSTLPATSFPVTDQDLHCTHCDYNLTGLSGDVCPECGRWIDWSAVRAGRLQPLRDDDTAWRCWPWWLKPAGFVVTALTMALLPWRLSRQLPERPRLAHPIAFALVCLSAPIVYLCGLLLTGDVSRDDLSSYLLWSGMALVSLGIESVILGLLFPVNRGASSIRFWTAAGCYASYPILLEVSLRSVPVLLLDESTIWPFPGEWLNPELTASIVFYLWCVDLLVVAFLRNRRKSWWRFSLGALFFPLLMFGACYAVLGIRTWLGF